MRIRLEVEVIEIVVLPLLPCDESAPSGMMIFAGMHQQAPCCFTLESELRTSKSDRHFKNWPQILSFSVICPAQPEKEGDSNERASGPSRYDSVPFLGQPIGLEFGQFFENP